MRLVPPVALQRRAGLGLVLLQATAVVGDLGWRQDGNGEIVAVAAKGLDCAALDSIFGILFLPSDGSLVCY